MEDVDDEDAKKTDVVMKLMKYIDVNKDDDDHDDYGEEDDVMKMITVTKESIDVNDKIDDNGVDDDGDDNISDDGYSLTLCHSLWLSLQGGLKQWSLLVVCL